MATIKVDVYNKFSGTLATYTFRVEDGTENYISTFSICSEKALKKFHREYPYTTINSHLYKTRRHID